MVKKLFHFFGGMILFACNAVSAANCPGFAELVSNAQTFANLPLITGAPLSEDVIHAIEAHSLATHFVRELGDGKSLVIEIQGYQPDNVTNGESIQAKFVAQTLKQIFPQTEFAGWGHYKGDKKIVEILIHDSVEDPDDAPRGAHLNMLLLKVANGTLRSLSHHNLRVALGIPNNKFIASFYMQNPKEFSFTDFVVSDGGIRGLIDKITDERGRRPDIVFVTPSEYSAEGDWHPPENIGYAIKKLSKVKAKDFVTGKLLVVNDMKGRVPYLHCVADLAVIEGPLNFLEPIQVGTPTVIANGPKRFAKMAQASDITLPLALQSGLAWDVASPEQFRNAIQQSKSIARKDSYPIYLEKLANRRIIDLYLDELENVIVNAIRGVKTRSPKRGDG